MTCWPRHLIVVAVVAVAMLSIAHDWNQPGLPRRSPLAIKVAGPSTPLTISGVALGQTRPEVAANPQLTLRPTHGPDVDEWCDLSGGWVSIKFNQEGRVARVSGPSLMLAGSSLTELGWDQRAPTMLTTLCRLLGEPETVWRDHYSSIAFEFPRHQLTFTVHRWGKDVHFDFALEHPQPFDLEFPTCGQAPRPRPFTPFAYTEFLKMQSPDYGIRL